VGRVDHPEHMIAALRRRPLRNESVLTGVSHRSPV
jgi:hypothetical protein